MLASTWHILACTGWSRYTHTAGPLHVWQCSVVLSRSLRMRGHTSVQVPGATWMTLEVACLYGTCVYEEQWADAHRAHEREHTPVAAAVCPEPDTLAQVADSGVWACLPPQPSLPPPLLPSPPPPSPPPPSPSPPSPPPSSSPPPSPPPPKPPPPPSESVKYSVFRTYLPACMFAKCTHAGKVCPAACSACAGR